MDNDTIAALASPLGKGGIAVIRVSGAATLPILQRILEKWPASPTPRRAYHVFVTDGQRHIDESITVFYKAPHSYTGEDSAEISIHSSPFLVEEVLNLACSHPPHDGHAVRMAMPGEFTFRAFKNGKMDLIQAESVNELINANSRCYAHMKFGTLEGKLSRFMTSLRQDLINLGVQVETKIEFEEDQYFDEIGITRHLGPPLQRLDTLLSNARFNDLLNKGLTVVLVGKVNVGKSSLFNTLLMEERSIISDIPGTTRDFIKEKIYMDGFPIDITDVAGINRKTDDHIEQLGIRRSLEKLESCDAVIFMLDASGKLEDTDKDIYRRIKNKEKLIIANKQDIMAPGVMESYQKTFEGETIHTVSVKDHVNIEAVTGFLKGLVGHVKEKEADYTVNQRQKSLLEKLQNVLLQVKEMAQSHGGHVELIAEEIRTAVDIIGQLMGAVTPDDILNEIFSQFCVGK